MKAALQIENCKASQTRHKLARQLGCAALLLCLAVGACDSPSTKVVSNVLVPASWLQVSTGGSHTLGIKSDSTLWAWGDNTYGQLGDGNHTAQLSPKRILSGFAPETWSQVSAGQFHSLGIKTDGTLWTWGDNTYGQIAQAGLQQTTPATTGAATWITVAAGCLHSLGVRTDTFLYTTGSSAYGQLGNGGTAQLNAFTLIDGVNVYSAVAAGCNHSVAIRSGGQVWGWGANDFGQLGVNDATGVPYLIPIREFSNKTTWTKIAAGDSHTLAIDGSTGALWSWGYNQYGQLGLGFNVPALELDPVIIGGSTVWSGVSAGKYHTLAFDSSGFLWAWGRNDQQQLGDLTSTDRYSQTLVLPLVPNFVAAFAGGNSSFAATSSRVILGWGNNQYGQLGDGTATTRGQAKAIQ